MRGVVIVAKINRIVVGRRQVVMETHQDGYVVQIQDRRPWIDAVVAPYIGRWDVWVKLMHRRLQVEIIVHMRQELVPPLMIGTRCFTMSGVGAERWRRIQGKLGYGYRRNRQ